MVLELGGIGTFALQLRKPEAQRGREITESLSWVCGIPIPWANVPPRLLGPVLASETPKESVTPFPKAFPHPCPFSWTKLPWASYRCLPALESVPSPSWSPVCPGCLLRVLGRNGHNLPSLVTTSTILDSVSLTMQPVVLIPHPHPPSAMSSKASPTPEALSHMVF